MPNRPPVHSPYGTALDARRRNDRERGSSHARGYDRNWRRFRIGFLARNPLCADCERRELLTPATEVHHVAKVADRPDLRFDPANVMALCQPCHSARTARGE
jgi:5-methylcytosine-specific restriction protein A